MSPELLKYTLEFAREPGGVDWVVGHWGLLVDEAGFLKDF